MIKKPKTLPQSGKRPKPRQPRVRPCAVLLSEIVDDRALQIRCEMDGDQINNLVEAYQAGQKVPPVDLFQDSNDGRYYIGDGWHRYLATEQIKHKDILAIVHPGGRAAALKHALGANANHGLRRTNKDKRRAVEVAIAEFPKLSARAIADLCSVGKSFAANILKQVSTVDTCRIGKDGKEYPASKPEPRTFTQTDFWDILRGEYADVIRKTQQVRGGPEYLQIMSQDPKMAADELESIADHLRAEYQELKRLAKACRQDAARSAKNTVNTYGSADSPEKGGAQ